MLRDSQLPLGVAFADGLYALIAALGLTALSIISYSISEIICM